MSFWSWLGLVDKKDYMSLQSEIRSLSEENKSIQEQNQRLIMALEESNKRSLDLLVKEIVTNREQLEKYSLQMEDRGEKLVGAVTETKSAIAYFDQQVHQQFDNCIGVLNENIQNVNEYKVGVRRELKKEHKDIQLILSEIQASILAKLQENIEGSNKQLMKEHKDIINKLASLSKQLEEKEVSIDDIQETLHSTSESLMSLWSITKAIWVDSILGDIEDAIK